MWNYVLPIGTAFIALLQLAKDWGGHQTHWRRITLLGLIMLLAIGSAVNSYYTARRAGAQHAKDQSEINGLRTAVETANQNQQANTRQFVDAFGKLSQRVGDLQTKVATEGLQRKLASVQLELQNTQKALAPAPKARLFFTFVPFDVGVMGKRSETPVTDVTLPLNLEGAVHVEFTVFNPTDIEATDGQYAIIVCDLCKFAKEPQGFTKIDGRPDTERYLLFPRIPAKAELPKASIDVLVPPFLDRFDVGVQYRCHTCDLQQTKEGVAGTVHVQGRMPPPS